MRGARAERQQGGGTCLRPPCWVHMGCGVHTAAFRPMQQHTGRQLLQAAGWRQGIRLHGHGTPQQHKHVQQQPCAPHLIRKGNFTLLSSKSLTVPLNHFFSDGQYVCMQRAHAARSIAKAHSAATTMLAAAP